jgi:hypothetical protein
MLGEANVSQEPRRSVSPSRVLVLLPLAEYPRAESQKRLEHEYSLREELDPTWVARPIAMARHRDRMVLVLEDPGGMPLDQLLGQPLEVAFSLRLAISLDPQRLNHLFDAFYTTKPQGLGMGLTISRSIVEAHGGRLRAKANTPRGAVFEFTLPIRDATQA